MSSGVQRAVWRAHFKLLFHKLWRHAKAVGVRGRGQVLELSPTFPGRTFAGCLSGVGRQESPPSVQAPHQDSFCACHPPIPLWPQDRTSAQMQPCLQRLGGWHRDSLVPSESLEIGPHSRTQDREGAGISSH